MFYKVLESSKKLEKVPESLKKFYIFQKVLKEKIPESSVRFQNDLENSRNF
jgi:hypothetical protein